MTSAPSVLGDDYPLVGMLTPARFSGSSSSPNRGCTRGLSSNKCLPAYEVEGERDAVDIIWRFLRCQGISFEQLCLHLSGTTHRGEAGHQSTGRVHDLPQSSRSCFVNGGAKMPHARAAASRAEGASPRARVPPVGYRDKLPPKPLVQFYAAAPVHILSAVDTLVLAAPGVELSAAGFCRTGLSGAPPLPHHRAYGSVHGGSSVVRGWTGRRVGARGPCGPIYAAGVALLCVADAPGSRGASLLIMIAFYSIETCVLASSSRRVIS